MILKVFQATSFNITSNNCINRVHCSDFDDAIDKSKELILRHPPPTHKRGSHGFRIYCYVKSKMYKLRGDYCNFSHFKINRFSYDN